MWNANPVQGLLEVAHLRSSSYQQAETLSKLFPPPQTPSQLCSTGLTPSGFQHSTLGPLLRYLFPDSIQTWGQGEVLPSPTHPHCRTDLRQLAHWAWLECFSVWPEVVFRVPSGLSRDTAIQRNAPFQPREQRWILDFSSLASWSLAWGLG